MKLGPFQVLVAGLVLTAAVAAFLYMPSSESPPAPPVPVVGKVEKSSDMSPIERERVTAAALSIVRTVRRDGVESLAAFVDMTAWRSLLTEQAEAAKEDALVRLLKDPVRAAEFGETLKIRTSGLFASMKEPVDVDDLSRTDDLYSITYKSEGRVFPQRVVLRKRDEGWKIVFVDFSPRG